MKTQVCNDLGERFSLHLSRLTENIEFQSYGCRRLHGNSGSGSMVFCSPNSEPCFHIASVERGLSASEWNVGKVDAPEAAHMVWNGLSGLEMFSNKRSYTALECGDRVILPQTARLHATLNDFAMKRLRMFSNVVICTASGLLPKRLSRSQ